MSTLRDRLLVLVYCLIAGLPALATTFHWQGRALVGVLPPSDPAVLTVANFLGEDYQAKWTARFENGLGLKGTSVAVDNTILYHLFGETRLGSEVTIGLDGFLQPSHDVRYRYLSREELPEPRRITGLVDKIAIAQELLRQRNRALIPVIIPAKTSLWPDKIPARWRHGNAPPASDASIYGAVRNAFERRGVRYVDVRKLFLESREPRERLWVPDARHWSTYGACLAVSQTLLQYRALLGAATPPHPCQLQLIPNTPDDGHNDLLHVLNVFFVQPAEAWQPSTAFPAAAPGWKPSVLFVATSFGWELVDDAQRSHAFSAWLFDYYDHTFYSGASLEKRPVRSRTQEWRDAVLDRDIYVLDLFETYLGEKDWYLHQFLDAMLYELARH